MKEKRKKVLICPLDWGLGHATRCIPLIQELIRQDAEVFIAATGESGELLKKEFPAVKYYSLPGVKINYGADGFSFLKSMMQLPALLFSVRKEHRNVEVLIKSLDIDIIISDNRYGLWSEKCYSVLITHQLHIMLPEKMRFMEKMVNRISGYYIKKFNCCAVPDDADHKVAGELSRPMIDFHHLKYIGILSRFKKTTSSPHHLITSSQKSYEILVVLSGPEPQRTLLEKLLITQLLPMKKSALIVRGLPGNAIQLPKESTLFFVNHQASQELNHHLLNSTYIICRSGYSSLMDLAATGRSAVIIPTPGQTEQEYLAAFHHKNKNHFAMKQDELNIGYALEKVNQLNSISMETSISDWVKELLQKVAV
ncbi:MAG: glycosyltransferase [Bacteroidota bacterium]